jgi:hypothetical protein
MCQTTLVHGTGGGRCTKSVHNMHNNCVQPLIAHLCKKCTRHPRNRLIPAVRQSKRPHEQCPNLGVQRGMTSHRIPACRLRLPCLHGLKPGRARGRGAAHQASDAGIYAELECLLPGALQGIGQSRRMKHVTEPAPSSCFTSCGGASSTADGLGYVARKCRTAA